MHFIPDIFIYFIFYLKAVAQRFMFLALNSVTVHIYEGQSVLFTVALNLSSALQLFCTQMVSPVVKDY